MRIVKNILLVIILLVLLSLVIATPIAAIGLLLFIAGLLLARQYRMGRWVMGAGVLLTLVLGTVYLEEPKETVKEASKTKVADVKDDQKAAEKKEKAEAEKKKAEAEKKKAAEAKAKADKKKQAAAKAEAEKKKIAAAQAAAAKKKQDELKAKQAAAAKKQQQQEQLAERFGLELVTVGRVVDGDTIETSDGRKVRFIGVNTPESTTRTEKYGKEASNYTASKLNGKKVWLQKDVSETDRYSRLLRVIWLAIPTDDRSEKEIRAKMFNADLVLKGYAEPSTYAPDVKYSDLFAKFAREARSSGSGLWAYGSDGTTKGDLDAKTAVSRSNPAPARKPAASPAPAPAPKPAPAATPAPASGSEYYQNCTELRKVYPNGVPAGHPAYASKHDRDKDNYACER
ncbi:excalibur calcium-binding domain-containing protein [Peribacillus sp. SCS-26]|uniref:excalibur calcium-binding domain-containing protein n=1 Tax=Paraperibacillus marinus TaxID=3115295 RepID=UPI0039058292